MSINNGVYQHYKGNLYRVLGTATHTETGEQLVMYQQTTGSRKIHARPASMWEDIVNINGEVAEVGKVRFKFVSL